MLSDEYEEEEEEESNSVYANEIEDHDYRARLNDGHSDSSFEVPQLDFGDYDSMSSRKDLPGLNSDSDSENIKDVSQDLNDSQSSDEEMPIVRPDLSEKSKELNEFINKYEVMYLKR